MRKTTSESKRFSESVGSLFEHYRDKLQRFLASRSYRPQEADDLAQEVYLRLLRFPPTEIIQRPQAYLYRIASNVVHDFNLQTREEPIAIDSDAAEELADQAVNVWSNGLLDQTIAEQELHRLLMRLPQGQLAALLLHMRDGLSYVEVAQALGIEVNTAKKRIARAVAQCRTMQRRHKKGGEHG